MFESSDFGYKKVDGRSLRWRLEDAGYKFKNKDDFLEFERTIDDSGLRLCEYRRFTVVGSTFIYRVLIPVMVLMYVLVLLFSCFRWMFTGEFSYSKDSFIFKITDKWYKMNHEIKYEEQGY